MPLKSMPLEEPAISLTSMLDVVLLLIMYFRLATQFIQDEQQYEIQLPTVPDAVALTGQPDEIVVNVEENGVIMVRTEQKSLDQLTELLVEAREKFPGQAVVVRGDGRVAYQSIMDVMSVIRRAGIRNLSLANRPNPAGS
ncbi:MAG: biopolymer transporter ExbD [Planctomycetales bacterium 12-60-4]|nr:MAG: biopolymer transporter ExbD [Planctomycetales bacterium 12-60-4]